MASGHVPNASTSSSAQTVYCSSNNSTRCLMFIGIRSGSRNEQPLRGVHAAALISSEFLDYLILTNIEFVVVRSEVEAYAFLQPPIIHSDGELQTRNAASQDYASPQRRAIRRRDAQLCLQSNRNKEHLQQSSSSVPARTTPTSCSSARQSSSSASTIPVACPRPRSQPKVTRRFPPTAKTNRLLANVTRRAREDQAERTAARCASFLHTTPDTTTPPTTQPESTPSAVPADTYTVAETAQLPQQFTFGEFDTFQDVLKRYPNA
jgi:hypothetical protein